MIKFKELASWVKGGVIFFSVSLVLTILTFICVLWVGETTPDAGLLCTYSTALPFLPYTILFNITGYSLFLFGIMINTLIGIILGLVIDYFVKLRIRRISIIFLLIIISEGLFIIILESFFEGLNYFLFLSIMLLTTVIYIIYLAYSKVKRMKKKAIREGMEYFTLFFSLLIFSINLSSAATLVPGLGHVHTGFSTFGGYSGVSDSSCPVILEDILPKYGYTVAELAERANDINVKWFALTDHSYCIDSGEFSIVKSDCNSVDSAYGNNFACLTGEEVSADNDLNALLSSDWFAVGIKTDPETPSKYARFYASESFYSPRLIVRYT